MTLLNKKTWKKAHVNRLYISNTFPIPSRSCPSVCDRAPEMLSAIDKGAARVSGQLKSPEHPST